MSLSDKQNGKKKIYALRRAKQLEVLGIDPRKPGEVPPAGAVMADQSRLGHINTYGLLPRFYIDLAFTCRDCGVEEVWTAEQQKWYYEEAKGHIDAKAVRCRSCRDLIKRGKDEDSEAKG